MSDTDYVDDEPLLDDDEPLDEDREIEDEEEDLLEPDDQDDEPDPEPRQHQRRPRAQERIRTLDAEKKAERERADRAEAELARVRQGPQKSQEDIQRERATYLAGLTPDQRVAFEMNEMRQQFTGALQGMEFRAHDTADKAAFAAKCVSNKAIAAVQDEVEAELAAMRKAGQNANRETIAAYVIGQRVLKKQTRASAAGAKRAAEGRERQGARPINGRGDAPPSRGRVGNEREARAKRLDGVKL